MTNIIRIYADKGAADDCIRCLEDTLRTARPEWTVSRIKAPELLRGEWVRSTSLLAVPGGGSGPIRDSLRDEGFEQIRAFVHAGGRYWGACSGGYLGASSTRFAVGTDIEKIKNDSESLCLYRGRAIGPAYDHYDYRSRRYARAATLLSDSFGPVSAYFNGGCYFDGDDPAMTIEARYIDIDHPAIIRTEYGSGQALMTGVHLEFPARRLNARDPFAGQFYAPLVAGEATRLRYVDHLLTKMDL